MIRLPATLERKLTELFPQIREREHFVIDLIQRAIEGEGYSPDEQPESVGGSLHLFTDGGSRGNPGQAAIACILEDPSTGKVIREHFEKIGKETNNVAEYKALIAGLRIAKRLHPNRLVCHLDSELVVKQLNGEYKIRMHTLQPLVEEIKELAQEFSSITFKHIPREDNYRADALVNRALG